MGVWGQDWASYQSANPDTTGLNFVFIKVTEGLSYISPAWQQQRNWAKQHGLVVGYYAYPHMHNNADSEVNYFLSNANPAINDLIVLDWEGYDANNTGLSNAEKLAYKEEFLRYAKSKLPHNAVGLYANTDYWYNVDTTGHAGDFLWIATSGLPAGQPGIKAKWTFHQYGASGVDRDFGNFTNVAAFKSWVNSFNPTQPEDDLPYTEAQLTNIVQQAVISQPVRDALAYANFYFLEELFAMKPIANPQGTQVLVNQIQAELSPVLGKLDPSVLAELQAAVANAIKTTGITATVEVNGTVK